MPLEVILSSDEREETLTQGLETLKSILPEKAFFGRGSSTGPMVIMTDDSASEQAALRQAWPSTTLLLCTFHFLQRRWTRLWEGKNKIREEHKKLLINQVKDMVYAVRNLITRALVIFSVKQCGKNISPVYNTHEISDRKGKGMGTLPPQMFDD